MTQLETVAGVRELSIMSVGQPLQDIALVELPTGLFGSPEQPQRQGGGSKARNQKHCVLLRAGGVLSLLDMEQGTGLFPAAFKICHSISLEKHRCL